MSDYWYVLLGGIQDIDWERLINGETLTIAQLGVETEFDSLLKGDRSDALVQSRTLPDIYRHPIELFPDGGAGNSTLSIRTHTSQASRSWQVGTPEPSGWSDGDNSLKQIGFPDQYVFWQGDGPIITLNRESWEKLLDALVFRRGSQMNSVFTIALPLKQELRMEFPLPVTAEKGTFAFKDIADVERDRLWRAACDDAISRSSQRLRDRANGVLPQALASGQVVYVPIGH